VIVVDDGSTDATADVVRAAALEVKLIRQDRLGAAEARNRGVAESSAPALAFLDSDCYPRADWLDAGLRALGHADLVQGHVKPDPGVPIGPFDRTLWVTVDIGLWQTASMFVTRELFDRIGGFEDWLPVEIGKLMAEDVWFGWRAVRAGARTTLASDCVAHHAVFARTAGEYIGERRRQRHFPAIARKMPELRETMFFRRVFLSRRTAAFDLGLAAGVAAAVTRSPLPLVGWLPWARLAWRRARGFGRRRAPVVLAADAVADLISAVDLARGSARERSPLL